jgi:hypothetical protein
MQLLRRSSCVALALSALGCAAPAAPTFLAAQPAAAAVASSSAGSSSSGGSDSLEQAAKRAGDTGRKVAMYLIGLAFAAGAVILIFKRDFREAAAIFGVGILAILLATPAGVNTLKSTVDALFN